MPDEALARLLGLDKQVFFKTLANLIEYGVAERDGTGTLINRRMVRDEELRKVRTENGKLGGNPALVNQNSTTQDNQKTTPSSSSSNSSSTTEEKSKKPPQKAAAKTKRGTRIPDKFFVDKYMKIWVTTECPGVDFTTETKKFCNHFRAKTGRDATKLDWRLTWENWMLNARDRFGASTNGNGKPKPDMHVGKSDPERTIAPDEPCRFCGQIMCLNNHREELLQEQSA